MAFFSRSPSPPPLLPSFIYNTPLPTPEPSPHADHSANPLLPPISPPLDRSLRRLETFLCLLGLSPFPLPSSIPTLLLPSFIFLVFGIVLPVLASVLARCDSAESAECQLVQVETFETTVMVSEAAVAAMSMACLWRSLHKCGIRRFLFLDQKRWDTDRRFQKEYLTKIQGFFRLAIWLFIPCLIVKITREGLHFAHLLNETSTWRAVVVLVASIVSWAYLTSIFLASCTLFYLVIILQVIHFEDYAKLLEQDRDPMLYLEEHMNLLHNLVKISHRFRMFLLLVFSFVNASLFVVLFITTAYGGKINFNNGANIAILSVVQVVGLMICINGAAKISHRAQGIASMGSRWHALVTCSSSNNDSSNHSTHRVAGMGNQVSLFPANFLTMDFIESDLDSLDNGPVQSNEQLAYYMSTYHKREALVLYLLANPGGITVFGWKIDRTLLNTVIMFELTLILFVLGKTFVLPSPKALENGVLRLF